MAKCEMAINATFLCFAERDQIRWIELKIGMQMEGAHVMHFEVFRAAAQLANRVESEVLLAHCRPVARAGARYRMLALGSIDEMFDDGHLKTRECGPLDQREMH
jgi:hypothetical protein